MFPGQCGNTAFFFKSQPDQFHFEFRGIVFPGKSFFSAHEVSTCKISGCLSYRILDSGPDGTQTTLTDMTNVLLIMPASRRDEWREQFIEGKQETIKTDRTGYQKKVKEFVGVPEFKVDTDIPTMA